MKTWNFVRFLLNKEGANMKKVIYSTNRGCKREAAKILPPTF
ncbi:hypothetical protein PTE_01770 [Photorhabdus khanii NC19]|uniref:Uncharacterized protein n=1 Tax=Photorhabdus khanii NC19 TaxID=1004151 RepID=W3V899_9GAMM|nr:hypothetical protein PTE_01770 [Photorhabdus khanii NC19]